MANTGNVKLRVLLLAQYLRDATDSEHGVTMTEILAHLASNGICAERKAIYDDMEQLRRAGMDVETLNPPRAQYRLLSREFEDAELKLLVDAVCASRFITQKKSRELITKLERLSSEYGRRDLARQVTVDRRVKSMNESIYINVDALHSAINSGRRAEFRYFDYDLDKKRVLRHGGAVYSVDPMGLMFSDGNYYLVAYNPVRAALNNYRVDRMTGVTVTDKPISKAAMASGFDPARYASEQFSMFGGERRNVRLRFENSLVDPVVDRFGKELTLVPDGPEHFTVTALVEISGAFFGWLFQFGNRASILSPDDVRERYRSLAGEVYGSV